MGIGVGVGGDGSVRGGKKSSSRPTSEGIKVIVKKALKGSMNRTLPPFIAFFRAFIITFRVFSPLLHHRDLSLHVAR
jgi:hypothetical protein